MLAELLSVPRTQQDWEIWSYHHRISHTLIRQTIRKQNNIFLNDYQLDPIPSTAVTDWLQRNAQTHNDMNNALGVQSQDMLDVSFDDEHQLRAWVYLHYQEHLTAERALNIGS